MRQHTQKESDRKIEMAYLIKFHYRCKLIYHENIVKCHFKNLKPIMRHKIVWIGQLESELHYVNSGKQVDHNLIRIVVDLERSHCVISNVKKTDTDLHLPLHQEIVEQDLFVSFLRSRRRQRVYCVLNREVFSLPVDIQNLGFTKLKGLSHRKD